MGHFHFVVMVILLSLYIAYPLLTFDLPTSPFLSINQAKPKTEVEARIFEALSHKNWGSSSTLMNEIARDTFDYERYSTITRIIWESLSNQRPAAWRVVFKALTLLEHLLKNGSERCVDDARNHSHILRNLFNFNYYEGTTDRGIGVREKSKQIVELLADDERVREERTKAKQLREKFGGNLGGVSSSGGGGGGGSSYAGYGNDDYGGYSGGSSGYGDSGIGSSSGGGFSGRYNDNDTKPTDTSPSKSSINDDGAAPTFAAIPEKKKKKTKKTSKKKKDKDDDVPTSAPPGMFRNMVYSLHHIPLLFICFWQLILHYFSIINVDRN